MRIRLPLLVLSLGLGLSVVWDMGGAPDGAGAEPALRRLRAPERERALDASQTAMDRAPRRDVLSEPRVELPASSPRPEEGGTGGEIERLLSDWDDVLASFQTDSPQVQKFNALMLALADEAEVVPNSIERDELGVRQGDLRIPGSDLDGKFFVQDDGRVAVRISRGAGMGGDVGSDLSVGFPGSEGNGSLTASMLSNPDLRLRPDDVLGPDEEQLTGWSFDLDPSGTRGEPVILGRAGARGWRIGASQTMDSVNEPGAYDTRAHDGWRGVLQPYLD